MSEVTTIGRYQLENLQRNRVKFLYLDLSETPYSGPQQSLLSDSEKISLANVLEFVNSRGFDKTYPIVLVCEDGTKAVEAAKELEGASYINVFAVAGGTQGF